MKSFIAILIIAAITGKTICCTTDEECMVDSTCTDGTCVCKKGFFLSSDKLACLPYVTQYNGECSEDAQCEWLGKNSVCNYVCMCEDGYRWFQGECRKYVGLGEDCTNNLDCFDGYNLQSFTCFEGKCACSDDYYQRSDTDCRKKATKIDDICALDIDCHFDNATCDRGKCRPSTEKLLEEEAKVTQTVFSYELFDLKQCETNDDCSDIPNSECYEKTGVCTCKHMYFFDGTTCIAELGVDVSCKNDSDCKIRPGKCEDGVCYCRDYYFVDDGNRNCVKTISQKNWNCLSKEWCYALGKYSFCSSAGTCNCSKIADLDVENVFCKWNGQNDPDMCIFDYHCKYIHNGYCIDEVCGCQDDHLLQDDKCIPKIGAPCDNELTLNCPLQNSECLNGICLCTEGYVSYQNEMCYLKKDQLGDECVVDVQCSAGITNSKCVKGKCNCDDNYLPYNNTCYEKKEYNSYCDNLLQCRISLGETFACRNRMCQCPTSYTMKEDKCSSSNARSGSFFVIAFALVLKCVLPIFC